MKKLLDRLDRSSRIALGIGIVLMILAIPLPTLLAVLLGLVAAAVLGFAFPTDAIQIAVLVAAPILLIAFIFGFVRGFNTLILILILIPSFVAPMWLAKQGAAMRTGRDVT